MIFIIKGFQTIAYIFSVISTDSVFLIVSIHT